MACELQPTVITSVQRPKGLSGYCFSVQIDPFASKLINDMLVLIIIRTRGRKQNVALKITSDVLHNSKF